MSSPSNAVDVEKLAAAAAEPDVAAEVEVELVSVPSAGAGGATMPASNGPSAVPSAQAGAAEVAAVAAAVPGPGPGPVPGSALQQLHAPVDAETNSWEEFSLIPLEVPLATAAEAPEPAQEQRYKVEGSDFSQILQLRLDPGDKVTTMPGCLIMTSSELSTQVRRTEGCWDGCKRCCMSNETPFRVIVRNNTTRNLFMMLSASGPGRVIAIELREYPGGLRVKAGAFLAAVGHDWALKAQPLRFTGACCWRDKDAEARQFLLIDHLQGQGTAFLTGTGTLKLLLLGPGQSVAVDTECLVACESTVTLDVVSNSECSAVCGGLGYHQAMLTGPGKVFIQSLPMERLSRAVSNGQVNGGQRFGKK